MRGHRNLTDLALLAAALLLVALWYGLGERPTDESSLVHPFARLEGRPPARLTLTRSGQELTIRRGDTGYVISEGPSRPLDPARVDGLLSALLSQNVLRDVPQPRDLEALGIVPTALTLSFEMADNVVRVTLGATSSTSPGERYATIAFGKQSRVVVLERPQADALDIQPDALVDHRVLDWVPSDIAEFTIERRGARARLKQLENGRFVFTDPPGRRADRKDVETLLLNLTQLTFERELAPDTPPLVADDTSITVQLTPFADRELIATTLTLGGACPGEPSQRRVSVESKGLRTGCVSPARFETLEVPRVDDHLFYLHGDEVETLTFERDPSTLVLERQGAAFILRKPREMSVALAAGNALLDSLTSLRGTLQDGCAQPANGPHTSIKLRSAIVGRAGPSDETITITQSTEGITLACRDDGQALRLTNEQVRQLTIDPELLASPELLALPFDSVDEILVASPAGRQRIKSNDSLHLQLVEPAFPGDASSIETLKEQLAQLTAERRLPRAAYASFLHTPHTTVWFWTRTEPGARTRHELRLYQGDGNAPLATLDDVVSPFLLHPEIISLLDGLLVDRSLYRLSETDRAFSISQGNSTLRCERNPQRFVCPSRPVDAPRLEQLIATLSEFRAQRVDLAPLPPTSTPITLTVYGESQHSPRFRLTLSQRFGQAARSPLRMTYPQESLRVLEAMLSNDSQTVSTN